MATAAIWAHFSFSPQRAGPNKYLPLGARGDSTIILVRKPSSEPGKRIVGLCITVAAFSFLTLPGFSMVIKPAAGRISWDGMPIAELVPPTPVVSRGSMCGSMKSSCTINGEIISPANDEDEWEVLRDPDRVANEPEI
jgi:hypothetical protein